ncbi:MAG: polyprenol monophosphomannose synthase [Phycisphaerales bacterium]|nr:MAG: polyprenol monophosphomannose synthase [Phycisphaerales bacterium]
MSSAAPAASIIVPTFREAANIEPLTRRVFAAISEAGLEAELIIVDDDSQDGTEDIVNSLAGEYPVRLIIRRGERGLASAVLVGLQEASHDSVVVLDADLQHPPEMIPDFVWALEQEDCDFVIGTRYGAGGGIAGDWPFMRRVVSWVATSLAKPLAPLSDPMSGFFAVGRRTWEGAAPLDPVGFKIALELYVKGRCRRPVEVPIRFEKRTAGASKLNVRQQIDYLKHLRRLYRFKLPRLSVAFPLFLLACLAVATLVTVRSCA